MVQFPSAQRKIGFGYRLLMSLIAASGLMVGERPHVRVASVVTVQPTQETQPHSGDADDAAIWIHPTDPALSVILGTHKTKGIGVYDLAGNELQFVNQDGGMNNIDLRYNFPLGGASVALVIATNRDSTHNTLAIYKINPATRQLENVTTSPPLQVGIGEVYGTCMYHSPFTGKYYGFINGTAGDVEQWELFDNGGGRVTGTRVRSFLVGSQTEGCVADDQLGYFYIGEEAVGIWKYGAEPGDGTARTPVDTTGVGGHITPQVEGLTLYYASADTGYLMASSQGSSEYIVYRREGNNDYLMTFTIVAGNGIDEVTLTDGIDVNNFSLGSLFPQGVFVAHDNTNDGGARNNFKLVPWPAIANAVNPALAIDTSWDPRTVGASPPQAQFAVYLPFIQCNR